jgi:two-component system, response regulator
MKSASETTRILLVEDDEDHAELVQRSLEDVEWKHALTHVKDGEEALDYLLRRGRYADPSSSPRPDVVFLDLRLPRVDGLEVLRQIKEQQDLREIPVVVLTTSDADRDLVDAYQRNVNAYVVKPVEFAELEQMIRDAGAFWLAWNRRPR